MGRAEQDEVTLTQFLNTRYNSVRTELKNTMTSGKKIQNTMTMNNVTPYHRDGSPSPDVNLLAHTVLGIGVQCHRHLSLKGIFICLINSSNMLLEVN
jgi:hypothetical protein